MYGRARASSVQDSSWTSRRNFKEKNGGRLARGKAERAGEMVNARSLSNPAASGSGADSAPLWVQGCLGGPIEVVGVSVGDLAPPRA